MNQAHTGSDPVCIFFLLSPSGLEAFLPDGLHAVADIVKDMPPLDAAPSKELFFAQYILRLSFALFSQFVWLSRLKSVILQN